MKKIRIPTENKFSSFEVIKVLREVRNKKARIFLGCPVLNYSTAVIRRYNEHYFLIDYTERNFYRYGYLCNIVETIEIIMQGIGGYKGRKLDYGLTHPDEKNNYTRMEIIELLRDFFFSCKVRLKRYAYMKCSTVKPKTAKQLVLF